MSRHGAGNATIAATSTIVASMPLQPASIETAKPFAVLRITLPIAATLGSITVTSHALIDGQRVGPRDDEVLLRPRRELRAEERDLQHDEGDEETNHRPILPKAAAAAFGPIPSRRGGG